MCVAKRLDGVVVGRIDDVRAFEFQEHRGVRVRRERRTRDAESRRAGIQAHVFRNADVRHVSFEIESRRIVEPSDGNRRSRVGDVRRNRHVGPLLRSVEKELGGSSGVGDRYVVPGVGRDRIGDDAPAAAIVELQLVGRGSSPCERPSVVGASFRISGKDHRLRRGSGVEPGFDSESGSALQLQRGNVGILEVISRSVEIRAAAYGGKRGIRSLRDVPVSRRHESVG